MANPGDVQVVDAAERRRFEATVDGQLAGFADYLPTDELVAFTHTEVLPEFEGRGVGSALARFGLDSVQQRGLRVLAVCPFISTYLQRHAADYPGLEYRSRTNTTTVD